MIARQLKELICQLGLSQRQFARKIDLDPGYLSRILQDKVMPPERILLLIANVFHVNRQWLEAGTGAVFSQQSESVAKQQIIDVIDSLDDRQIEAVKAFLSYLKQEAERNKACD